MRSTLNTQPAHGGRARWAAIGAAVAVMLGAGGLMTATAVTNSGERAIFVPITPCRVMDTRAAPETVGKRSTPIGPAETLTISVIGVNGFCTIPNDAVGLSLNVTAVNPTVGSFLTVFPADAPRPLASNLNYVAGAAPVPNAVTVDIAANGTVSFYNNSGTVDVVADIVGYYEDHNHDDRYYTKAEADGRTGKQKYISVDLLGTFTQATIDRLSGTGLTGLIFKDNIAAESFVSFVAPPDLTPDTKMTLQVTFGVPQTNCTVSVHPTTIWVTRPGETAATVPVAPAPLPGFVAVGGDPRPAPSPAGAVGVATFTLGRPLDGAGFRPGDTVSLRFARNGAADTCTADLVVTGLQVLYT